MERILITPLIEDSDIELITDIDFYVEDAFRYHITYHLSNELGEVLFSFHNAFSMDEIKQGNNLVSCVFPKYFFQSGVFNLSFFVVEDKRRSVFNESDIITFSIVDGSRELGVYMGREPGYIKPQFKWKIR